MDKTKAALKVVLADTFVMYFRAHSYHWNVEGSNFSEMHNFFGGIYTDLYETVDIWAEQLRALQEYAPISIEELYNNKTLLEDIVKPLTSNDMLLNIAVSNHTIINNLNVLFRVATEENLHNIADLAAARLDIHRKSGWMVNSYLKV